MYHRHLKCSSHARKETVKSTLPRRQQHKHQIPHRLGRASQALTLSPQMLRSSNHCRKQYAKHPLPVQKIQLFFRKAKGVCYGTRMLFRVPTWLSLLLHQILQILTSYLYRSSVGHLFSINSVLIVCISTIRKRGIHGRRGPRSTR